MMTPEKYVARMLEASRKKQELLLEILEFTQQQCEVISEETTDQLDALLNEKQKRIDAVNGLDEEFKVYYERLKYEMKVKSLEELHAGSIDGLRELQQCVGGMLRTMNEISALEKQNQTKANQVLEEIGREIRKLNQGKKANNLYSPVNLQPTAYFIDKKN